MLSDGLLSRDEIRTLLERNNANPELGRPVYVCWTANKPTSTMGTDTPSVAACDIDHHRWMRQLNSKTWRIQRKGSKTAEIVTRPVKKLGGAWSMVPLNSRGV